MLKHAGHLLAGGKTVCAFAVDNNFWTVNVTKSAENRLFRGVKTARLFIGRNKSVKPFMRSFHGLVHAKNNVVVLVKMAVNIGVIIGIALISLKKEVGKRENLKFDRLIAYVFKGKSPNFTRIGIVYKNSCGGFYAETFTRNNRIAQSVNTTVIVNFGAHRVVTGVKYFARFFVSNVKIAVSVADNRGTASVFGANICQCTTAVGSNTAAEVVNSGEQFRVPHIVEKRTFKVIIVNTVFLAAVYK